MPDFVVAIPARYAASRLPGKPLRLNATERQPAEWLIGFDAEDKIAALLFRPAES